MQNKYKKYYNKAHERFSKMLIKISKLGLKDHDKAERALKRLEKLLQHPSEEGCFFPAHEMPIYKDIISGDFIRQAKKGAILDKNKTPTWILSNVGTIIIGVICIVIACILFS